MDKGSKPVPAWADSNPIFRLTYKTARMIKNEGLSQTIFASKYVIKRAIGLRSIKKELATPDYTKDGSGFRVQPQISVIVPLYNTPDRFLRDMIDSVIKQSYKNWQLCLANGSDVEHGAVEKTCLEYAERDARITYKKLEKNYGIAGNTNAAVELANGDYIALLDHDDMLVWSALYEVAKVINECGADFIYTDEALFSKRPSDSRTMHFKPDFSPDYLRGCNYICHLSVIKKELAMSAGLYDKSYDGSQDYDFTLRVTECAQKIVHIAKPLYFWRVHAGSVASDISVKPYAYDAAKRAVQSHIDRVGLKGEVVYSKAVPMMRVIYDTSSNPLVSIIIPTCDHPHDLKRCVNSIFDKSTYKNFEIIICENNSKLPETFEMYEQLEAKDNRVKVITWPGEFNFSAINNFARNYASGEHLLFLNNDTEVITPEWIEEMLMFTERSDVGACGVKLLYPNDTVQHGGIAVGVCGSAANLCPLFPREHEGFMSRLAIASNVSACTAACLMIRASVFNEIGGFDETLAVSFNDVDICLKIREKGYLVVFNPVCELYHYESVSRGYDKKGEKKARMEREKELLRVKWPRYFAEDGGDPYYNRNFGKNSVSYDA